MDRFGFCNYPDGAYMHKCDDGEYCLYDDYEAMEKRAIAAESKLAEIEKQEPVAHRWVDINRDGEPYYEYEDGEPFVGKEIDCKYKYRRLYELPVRPLPAVAVPDGWKLVPVEPTFEMCKAGEFPLEYPHFPSRYKAMLSEAPTPPSAEHAEIPYEFPLNELIHKVENEHNCVLGDNIKANILKHLRSLAEQPDSAAPNEHVAEITFAHKGKSDG